jgi:hypothetical protein
MEPQVVAMIFILFLQQMESDSYDLKVFWVHKSHGFMDVFLPFEIFSKFDPKIRYGFWTKLGTFGYSSRNHFSQKIKCKKWGK